MYALNSKQELQAKVAVILGRVSSKPQEDGYSIDGQINKGRNYCERKGLQIIQEYTFQESSTRGNRPKFFEMIKFIKKQKEPVALICDKVDRLQRGFKEAPIIEELRKSGKLEIHLITENQVLHQNSTSQELMVYNMWVMMAQNYTDSLSDNIRRSHNEMISQGRVFTKLRVGYKRSETNNKDIIIDDSCAFLIRKLFVEYSTGLYSIDEIHAKATEWGLKNKKTGKPFNRSNIGKILQDEFYIGTEVINKGKKNEIRYKHIYPHLISDELFEKCRKVREGKGHNHSNKTKDDRHILFKGMIKCKHCGCTVTPEPPKKGKYIYLRPKPKKGCNCKQINEEVANKLVEGVLKSMTIPEEVLNLYLDKLKKRFDTQQQEETLQQKMKLQDLENTRRDFLKHYTKLDANKVFTTLLASNESFKKVDKNLSSIKQKYNIPQDKKYIFSLCTLEPRKNLIRAVKTFIDFIKKNDIDDMVFVLGGGQWDFFIEKLDKEIEDLGMYKDKVIKAGYIDDKDLPALYTSAEWFVYTSQYEGFGLPPLEAMSCGCPVITSNNSSLPEVVGDAGIMIDWDSDEQHIKAYEKYYFEEAYRNEMAHKGLERSTHFSWEKCVTEMVNSMKGNK